MNFRRHSYDFLWLSLALLILLSLALLLPLSPQDYWWYLRLGQDVARTGSVPAIDTYSFTQTGSPFFYQSWLAAVIFWKTYQSGGLMLTFFLRAVIIAITYILLWSLVRSAGVGPRLASLLVLLAALAGSSNWSFRPQLFIYPIFVLVLYILSKWTQGKNRGLWLMPILSMLWVNLHGSFPLLFILGAAAFIFGKGDKKQLAYALGVSLFAVFINPHGIHVLGYVKNMLNAPSNQLFSVEWMPMVNSGWQANLFFAWLLIFAPLAAFSSRKLTLLEWVNFLFFGWLALLGVRYVIWFIFIMVTLTASLVAEWDARILESPVKNEKPALNILTACVLLLIPFALLPGVRGSWWPDAPRAYDGANPIQAAGWLSAHPEIKGPLWSDYGFSSYLIFALPSRPVWIDTRFELYPPQQWEEYLSIANAAPQWESLLDRENIQLVMLSTIGQPSLISTMRDSTQWCEDYYDEDAVIFSRATGQCP
ncbi:MAG: hypothetical protein HZB50_11065 [Chloroflexi bacterium]|nr:hypothetical protein [Chloroflexota bacterium]